jgi:hypothetical protein
MADKLIYKYTENQRELMNEYMMGLQAIQKYILK